MLNYFLAGVGRVTIFEGERLIGVAKTLIDSSFDLSVQKTEIRCGQGAGLLAVYIHSANLDFSFTQALFDLDYLRLQTGGKQKFGSDYLFQEKILCVNDGELRVSRVPRPFYNTQSTLGWVDENVVTFNDKLTKHTIFKKGESYCIKYFDYDPATREITIPSEILPSIVRCSVEIPLYFGYSKELTTVKKVGKIILEIPRLSLNGNFKLNMNMRGYTNTPFSGTALVNQSGCGDGHLATIKQIINVRVDRTIDEIDNLTLEGLDNKTVEELDFKMIPYTK